MRIITYSDLHLEFGSGWLLPPEVEGDVLILAGDSVTFKNYDPLRRLIDGWKKPVLYVAGNHEYYTRRSMNEEGTNFRAWLQANCPQVSLLLDEGISIGGVNFFGGTMWTDFNGGNQLAMKTAGEQMNDFRLIHNANNRPFTPAEAITQHQKFVDALLAWFEKDLGGPRVVISHTAPLTNPRTKFSGSPLRPAFNSLDMVKVIEHYQPALWVYGHTHECDDQTVGKTRIISNQLGYPDQFGGFECKDFDRAGLPIDISED